MIRKIKLLSCIVLSLIVLSSCLLISPSAEGKETVTAVTVKNSNGEVINDLKTDNNNEAWEFVKSNMGQDKTVELVMGSDWDEDISLEIAEKCAVIFDLNGHTLKRNRNKQQIGGGHVFLVKGGAKLTIKDSDPESKGYDGIRGGVITGGASSDGAGGIHILRGASVEMQGGTLYRCFTSQHGGAVLLAGDSGYSTSFNMSGGRIYFCQTVGAVTNCHGGAIYADKADVTLKNAKIDSCYSEDNGGGVYLNNGTLKAEKTFFLGNHCLDYGGGIYISNGTFEVKGCRFSTNESKDCGGGIYIDNGDSNIINNCIFHRNSSGVDGGAVYVNDDKTFIFDTDIISNKAERHGGGIFVDSRYDINLKGLVRIYNNAGSENTNNITLQSGKATTAYVYNGGLTEGSRVGLSSTGRNITVCKDMTKYQADRYYFADKGSLELKDEYEKSSFMTASVFTPASIAVIAVFSLLIIGGIVLMIIYGRKKKRGVRP